ncbi:MAG: sugar ABC transporter permease [Nitriliruptor sp.]|nr:MAG: sugar ABC transporter permease [Nitriliruptor sp.]
MADSETPTAASTTTERSDPRQTVQSLLRATEVDTRLLGLLMGLAVIWIGFNYMSGGTFLSPRNLWNLSIQFAAVATMATGMVLVIVSRNIDLSVGSMLAALATAMALLQSEILPGLLGFDHAATWIITLLAGIVLGALIGGFQGVIIAYVGVPAFIVTLGGLLVWRGVAFLMAGGRTIAPLDSNFRLIGGGSAGVIGGGWSWFLAVVACLAIIALILNNRRMRRRYGFRLRPLWAEITVGGLLCTAVLVGVGTLNRYYMPESLARSYAESQGMEWPEGGLDIPMGLAYPVLIAVGIALVMTFVANRRRFGRYIYAIGGNPEAAKLGGINTRWTTVKIFTLMGMLVAVAAAIQSARLNAAVSGMGQLNELYVIAAAVIGGTSLAGGVGTIAGAMLGALVMQSLQSGMVLMGVDAPLQTVVVGIVLVFAVAIDSYYQRRTK